MRIGSIIIFYPNKPWKTKFFILCDVIFMVRLQGNLKLITLGSERVKKCMSRKLCTRGTEVPRGVKFYCKCNPSYMAVATNADQKKWRHRYCTLKHKLHAALSFLVHSSGETGASERQSRAETGEEVRRAPLSLQSRARSCFSLAPVSRLLKEKKGTACSLSQTALLFLSAICCQTPAKRPSRKLQ